MTNTKTRLFWLGCSLVLTISCASKNEKKDVVTDASTPTQQRSASDLSSDETTPPLPLIRKSQQIVKDKTLFDLLISKMSSGSTLKQFEIFDLKCELGDGGKRLCTGWKHPKSFKSKQRKKVIWTGGDANDLFGAMAMLPIDKGDTGAATEYINCEKRNEHSASPDYDCRVSMPIHLVPHSGMTPILE